MKGSVHIHRGKRGTSIRASGAAARQIFEALASGLGEPVPFIAYCWASGQIDFGPKVPDGAIEIARGDADLVRQVIIATARHGKRMLTSAVEELTLLVPGVPEAADQVAAGDALGAWLLWLKGREAPGLTIAIGDQTTYDPFYAGSAAGESYFNISADDRIRAVSTFNVHQLRAALRVPDLQKTVRTAIERRLRQLERAS